MRVTIISVCCAHPEPCESVVGEFTVESTDEYRPKKMVYVRGNCDGDVVIPMDVYRVEEEEDDKR